MVGKNVIKIEKWFGKRKELAAVRTCCSHIGNMCKGVQYVSEELNHHHHYERSAKHGAKFFPIYQTNLSMSGRPGDAFKKLISPKLYI